MAIEIDSTWFDDIQNLTFKLNNYNHEVRKSTAIKLGEIRSVRAVPSIIQQIYRERYFFQIKKYTENVSKYYFEALENIGPESTTYILEEIIDCPDDVYREFFKLLNKFSEEDDRSYKLIRNLFLTEDDPYILTELIVFWCYLKEKRAFDIVYRWLNHESADVVRAVCAYYFLFGEDGRKLIEEKLHQQLSDIKSKETIIKYAYDKIQVYSEVQSELDKCRLSA